MGFGGGPPVCFLDILELSNVKFELRLCRWVIKWTPSLERPNGGLLPRKYVRMYTLEFDT